VRTRQTERARSAEQFFSRLFEHVDPRDEPDMGSQAAKATPDLVDVHGFIPHDCKMPMIRQFLLKVRVPVKAHEFIGRLVGSHRKK
jgi:hypothetical protein